MQLRLDLILFIVQLGAAGPPNTLLQCKVTYILNKEDISQNFPPPSPINALIELSNIDIN